MKQEKVSHVTVNQLVEYGLSQLKEHNKVDAKIDAELLLEEVLGYTRLDRILKSNEYVDQERVALYKEYVAKRCEGIPLQYIISKQEFMGLKFYVDNNVLIPRQDTETLVETLLEKAKIIPIQNIVEIGVGSGCISISLAKFLPNTRVVGIDISRGALEVATKNGIMNRVEERIMWIQSDLFENYRVVDGVDLIVSNPPYITTSDCQELEEEVKSHEPMTALDGGNDGLYFYRKITKEAKKYLRKGGMLAYEIGYNQGIDVMNILKENGFEDVELIQDLGRKDRVVLGIA